MTAPETRVPELVGGIDIRSLPLSALEGFVLSRVDGRSPIREIAMVTGLPVSQVSEILERLRGLGGVKFRGEASDAREQPGARKAPGSGAAHAGSANGTAGNAGRPAPPSSPQAAPKPSAPVKLSQPPKYDPKELEEECDLPVERRKQVLDLFYALADLDYYEALDLPYDAEKKQIRAAYFALSKAFHPDTMFRKNLGSFKAKMEHVFKVLTEAYETLSKKKAREEYDAYLRATKSAQMAERALIMSAQQAAEAEAALNVEVPRAPPVPQIPVVPISSIPPPEELPSAGRVAREASPEARRLAQEVIARRLRGVTSGGRPPAAAPPAAAPPTPSKPAAPPIRTDPKELVRRLASTLKDVARVTGTNDQVQRTVNAAQSALARGDLDQATQLMRKAVSLAPNRPELAQEHEQLSKLLSEKLVNDYLVKAQFEMKHGKWAPAALAWSKVCEASPKDAQAHRMAAQCLLKVGGDLRGAQKYAQQAAFLSPNDLDIRVLNAQIYLTLGLKLNAKRELDIAAKLDPESEMVKNLLSDLMKSQ